MTGRQGLHICETSWETLDLACFGKFNLNNKQRWLGLGFRGSGFGAKVLGEEGQFTNY